MSKQPVGTAHTPAAGLEPAARPGQVNTVSGPVDADQLGFTLVHEHFSFNFGGWYADSTLYPYDANKVKELALKWLADVKAVGVKTVVDLTPNDCGLRDPKLFRELANQTGINIICCTGLYTETHGAPRYWMYRQSLGCDIGKEISEMMIAEITRGIGDTKIKAGVIKVATGATITPYEEQVIRAASIARNATGVPVFTHCDDDTVGIAQVDMFKKYEADMRYVAIGHMNNSSDINYLKAILAKDPHVTLSFDRTGVFGTERDELTASLIARLISVDAAVASRIVFGHDYVPYWPGRLPEYTPAVNWYPTYVAKGFHDLLIADGVTEAQFEQMTTANPKRLYSGLK